MTTPTAPPLLGSTSINRVFQKVQPSQTFIYDLAADLGVGEVVTGVSITSVAPSTTIPLTATATPSATVPTTFLLAVSAGNEGITYNVPLTVTTNLRTLFASALVSYQPASLVNEYTHLSPNSIPALIGSITSGAAGLGRAYFVLPPSTDTSQLYVLWDLVDSDGRIHSSGNAHNQITSPTNFSTILEADAVVYVPSNTPATYANTSYQVRWTLHGPSAPGLVLPQMLAESLTVLSQANVPWGSVDLVEVKGDPVVLSYVSDRVYTNVSVEVYKQDTRVAGPSAAVSPKQVASGWLYEVALDTTPLPEAMEAYTVLWKATDPNHPQVVRVDSNLFLVTPSILSACRDVQSRVMKARATLRQDSDLMFDHPTILTWLRRGRDFFNGVGGIPTDFTMTSATSAVREFWLSYSEAFALQAQSLAEGEKAFDFQGSDISLNVDHQQYYDALADKLIQQTNEHVEPLKKMLSIKGVTGGNGDITGVSAMSNRSALGAVGLSLSAISPTAGRNGYTRPWPY